MDTKKAAGYKLMGLILLVVVMIVMITLLSVGIYNNIHNA